MKTARFTQSINLSVTIETEVPDDWDDTVVQEFAKEWVTNITVNEPDDPAYNGTEFVLTELTLDSAEVTDATVWTED